MGQQSVRLGLPLYCILLLSFNTVCILSERRQKGKNMKKVSISSFRLQLSCSKGDVLDLTPLVDSE